MQWIASDSPITFPGLGLSLDPPVGFTLGPLTINFYGMIIALGLVLAVVYGWKRASQFGIRPDDITDGVLWIVPLAIICARIYYCAFTWTENGYDKDPVTVLHIWNGGLAIYGGIIGAAIGVTVFCLIKKIKLPALLDLVALGFLIGQSIGRWGNFFNREAFGAETDIFLRMGLNLTAAGRETTQTYYYHPTFLYESLWNAAGFVLLHFLSKRRKYDGQIALGYLAWYGLGRALIEGLRTDSLYLGPFRVSQLLAAATCAVGVILLMVFSFRYHSPDKLYVNQMAVSAEPISAKDAPEEASEPAAEEEPLREAAEASEAAEITEET